MTSHPDAEQALLGLIESGVSASAGKLATTSRTEWKTETVSIRSASLDAVQALLAGDDTPHTGAFFTIPGGVFVVMFTTQSSRALAKAFLSNRDPSLAARLEQESMAEISNIVVHCVANVVADACDEIIFVSAPEMRAGKKADLIKIAGAKFKAGDETSAIFAYVHLYSVALSSDCTIVLLLNSIWRNRLLKALDR